MKNALHRFILIILLMITVQGKARMNQHRGYLEVICGSMFSGKSEELIRRLRRSKIAKQNVAVFKPTIDTRYDGEKVASHDGNKIDAYAISTIDDIFTVTNLGHITVIGIDEVQFFPKSIVSVICKWIEEGKRVIVAGLDLDFRGIPFEPMPTLLALADKITKLKAICTTCGNEAHYSQRLINNAPAKHDDPVILVGAQEAYQARCRGCYAIDQLPQL